MSIEEKNLTILNASYFDTEIGQMLAIADQDGLYILEFSDNTKLEKKIAKTKATILPGKTPIISLIEQEIKQYFARNLKEFKTPFHMIGSDFQKRVWQALLDIPHGKTSTYMAQSLAISRPTAYRAVANANGANSLAIIVPCHRIINSNGNIGGYGGGIHRKQWLLNHEKQL